MINIKIYGLDQFLVGDLSREISQNIANIYEVSGDDVNFIAPNSMIFHEGSEQTSWHVLVEVNAPKKLQVLQDQVALYLIKILKEVSIHIEVIFNYYSQDDRVISINDEYPRYITDSNSVSIEEDYEEDECDDENCDHHHDDEEIFDGDIFQDFNKMVSNKK